MTVLERTERFTAAARSGRTRRWVVVGALVALLAGLVWALWFSPWLVVREVRVLGAVDVSADQVRQAADVPARQPLARVDVEGVVQRVGAIPRVASVEVRRGWPDVLVVVVTERTPVAAVLQGTSYILVDATGATFGSANRPPRGMPVVTASSDAALASAAAVVAALPADLRATVTTVAARTLDDVELTLTGGSRVQWGSVERSDRKAEVLRALLPQAAAEYDVSAPDLPTTRGTRT